MYNLILPIVVRGSVCVIWDINHALFPVDQGVCLFQPGDPQDDILISTADDVEENKVDDSFNPDKHGGNEFDDSCTVVGTINVLGVNGFRESVVWEFVLFKKSPIKAVD